MGSGLQSILCSVALSEERKTKLILETACPIKEGDLVAIWQEEKINLVKLTDALLNEIEGSETLHMIGKLYAMETELI